MELEITATGFRKVSDTRYERGTDTFYQCDRAGRWYLRRPGSLPQELGRTKREAVNDLIERRRADICLNCPFRMCISASSLECPLRQFNDHLRAVKKGQAASRGHFSLKSELPLAE